MEQQVPNITDQDIQRIIKRDFPQFEFNEIKDILGRYRSKNKNGRNRVHASILKLSTGNIELLRKNVEKAIFDFRDILALSEYPSYSEYAFEENVPLEKKEQLIKDDWALYQNWLNKVK